MCNNHITAEVYQLLPLNKQLFNLTLLLSNLFPPYSQVEGLTALILCSGVIVAAGNEPFRLGNYSFQRTGQMAQVMYMETVEPSMLQPRARTY